MMSIVNETIIVEEIKGNSVTYSGSAFWDGCLIENFPHEPKVGDKFNLATNFGSSEPPIITEISDVRSLV